MKTDHITEGLVRIRDELRMEGQRDILAQAANKLQAMDKALRRLLAAEEDGCLCSEMEMATAMDEARAALETQST